MKKIICVDINPLVHINELKNSLDFYKRNDKNLNLNVPQIDNGICKKNFRQVLKQYFMIDYRAPYDAKETTLLEGSIDYIASNVTLEHIPKEDIKMIMKECYRILSKDGIMSVTIDYQDHWSYFDKSISVYNYLRYEEDEWKKYNPSMHYQNRLRHCDYIQIFEEAGFSIKKVYTEEYTEEDRDNCRKIKKASCFNKYAEEEILIKSAHFILCKT